MSPHRWVDTGRWHGTREGEARGIVVRARGVRRLAYLKPTLPMPDEPAHARAAREKIASDLAHDLALPVPAAQLTFWKGVWSEPVPAVVSLIARREHQTWQDVVSIAARRPRVTVERIPGVARIASRMLVFDTWLDQTDHAEHTTNILVAEDARGGLDLVFVDYANSMGHDGSWAKGAAATMRVAPFPGKLAAMARRQEIEAAVRRIAALPEDAIRRVVNRLPATHLPEGQRDVVAGGLLDRRRALRSLAWPDVV